MAKYIIYLIFGADCGNKYLVQSLQLSTKRVSLTHGSERKPPADDIALRASQQRYAFLYLQTGQRGENESGKHRRRQVHQQD
jgi:hypothetical protein